jgi:prepilin signal peptidase PulO-like enzyme (type II secretory pathway)
MDFLWLWLTYIAVFGLFFGSFLHVIVYRTHEGEKWWSGRSHCPHCGKTLTWKELIPLLSFALQKGRCRKCNSPIPWRYPLVEILTAVISFVIFFILGISVETALVWLIFMFVWANFLSDYFYMELPDEFSIPSIILALLYSIVYTELAWSNLAIAIGFGAFFFIAQYVLTKGEGIGDGDIRLGVLMGALLGWPMTLFSIMMAYIGGSVISLGLLATKRASMKSALPLGVFLLPALFISFLFYENILNFISGVMMIEFITP